MGRPSRRERRAGTASASKIGGPPGSRSVTKPSIISAVPVVLAGMVAMVVVSALVAVFIERNTPHQRMQELLASFAALSQLRPGHSAGVTTYGTVGHTAEPLPIGFGYVSITTPPS